MPNEQIIGKNIYSMRSQNSENLNLSNNNDIFDGTDTEPPITINDLLIGETDIELNDGNAVWKTFEMYDI